ncbi:MAG: glycosyltransferase family 39 protein, partial [Selenomonadaceae bacterium]|nr:glycosyltransferase family 39 protein [Selenomonadaceae bacterium]
MNSLHLIMLFGLSLILFFLGGGLIPITDPTECCYTLTAKEMLAAGDWLSPRIYGDFWFDKPIMFYWELLLAYKIFGVGEFASRFFPAVFATGGIFLTYFFGAKLYNGKIGFVAAVMLATSLEFWYLSHAVITDMTLLFTFSLTLITFFLGYRANNPKLYFWSFAASGVAILTKGPIGFFLPGLIILI